MEDLMIRLGETFAQLGYGYRFSPREFNYEDMEETIFQNYRRNLSDQLKHLLNLGLDAGREVADFIRLLEDFEKKTSQPVETKDLRLLEGFKKIASQPVKTRDLRLGRPVDIKSLDLVIGSRVEHEKFGPGLVRLISQDQDDRILIIEFINGEERKFKESMTPLKLVR